MGELLGIATLASLTQNRHDRGTQVKGGEVLYKVHKASSSSVT
jgi:hypothetical protein